jgi:O-antigen ligase
MKGSFAAPLFFLSLAVACASSRLGFVTPWATAAALLAFAGWAGATGDDSAPSRILAAVCGYALLVAFNTLLLSPAYTPAGLYHPLLLALAFATFRRFDDLAERRSACAALALGSILAAWGLAQIGALDVARAHAVFETPATYAAVINLLLVPLLALVMTGRRAASLLAVGGLLAAAMFAADSRGGLLALAAGLGMAAVLALRAGMLRRRGMALTLALLAAGWILAAGLRTSVTAPPTAEAQAASSQSRLELYGLSWRAWLDHPLGGTGYLTFRYSLEQGRSQVPSYGAASETWFVHNDYLQTLQELGPLGLAALLALVGFPAWLSYRRIPVVPVERRAVALAAASALAAMGFHALVEFPFYIPVCLLLYGALLGALDRRLGEALAAPWRPAPWHPAVRTGILLIAGIVLLRPVAAEAAAEWGLRRSMAGAGRDAAFWLGTARRIEPADWRYHWYAGQFWDAQAADAGKREAARLAADAFAAGFDANPLEVRNLLGRIAVHRRHRALLDAPADRHTLLAWLAQAEALAPLNREVRRERELLGAAK